MSLLHSQAVRLAAATALLALSTHNAQAALTAFTSQANFMAAVGNAATDSFDDLHKGDVVDSPLARSAGGYGYTASTGSLSDFFLAGSGADTWLSPDSRIDTVSFSNFSGGASAVGGFFFGANSSGNAAAISSLTVTATDADGATLTQVLSSPTRTSYLGFSSTTRLVSLTVTLDQLSRWSAINDLTLAQTTAPVPEPQSLALMLIGLGALGLLARRRRTR